MQGADVVDVGIELGGGLEMLPSQSVIRVHMVVGVETQPALVVREQVGELDGADLADVV